MSNKVALILTSYNMTERTDALIERIRRDVCWPVDYYVVDNASDLQPPSQYTTVPLAENRQTTGGWLAGLEAAKASGEKYLAYWFLITSAEIPDGAGDILSPMASWLVDNPDAVGVHPALTEDSTTHWVHLLARGGDAPRQTWMIDNVASLYRADWFDETGWFDPQLIYAWGIDLETCWLARKQGKSLWVDERAQIKKVTDIGYKLERMRMTANERQVKATENMHQVLSAKYGQGWHDMMLYDDVTGAMA